MTNPCNGDCASCLELDRKLRLACNDNGYDGIAKGLFATWRQEHGLTKKFSHKGNGKPRGLWVGTLTMAPTDPINEEIMITAMRKIFAQKTSPVQKYAWYLEYTANGLPHIHFIYKTANGGRILQKVFNRIYPTWKEDEAVGNGHRGGYHALCHNDDAYLKYIAKDGGRHDQSGF